MEQRNDRGPDPVASGTDLVSSPDGPTSGIASAPAPDTGSDLLPDTGSGLPSETASGSASQAVNRRAHRRRVPLIFGLSTAILFTVGALAVYRMVAVADVVLPIDHTVLYWGLAERTPGRDAVITGFTNLGGSIGMTILAGCTAVLISVLQRSWIPLITVACTAAGTISITILGKTAFARSRPDFEFAVPPLEHGYSFPSGHSLNAVALTAVAVYLLVRWQRTRLARTLTIVVGTVFALGMCLSRLFLGHHWATDVLAGICIALAWAAVVIATHAIVDLERRRRRAQDSISALRSVAA
ncbi:phosphatase PAP2 family protein [Saxibacter everestensis]|uniref:Phosphatase PAP2 family protein n=1 Tax=Saxibacter everestensis TaxID=2909229 RepID=A0ABY8QTA4_9MICO|nr:phosphatase PAP2 family protein [Brevibacteriaceae bacterium ZFBP1038]